MNKQLALIALRALYNEHIKDSLAQINSFPKTLTLEDQIAAMFWVNCDKRIDELEFDITNT